MSGNNPVGRFLALRFTGQDAVNNPDFGLSGADEMVLLYDKVAGNAYISTNGSAWKVIDAGTGTTPFQEDGAGNIAEVNLLARLVLGASTTTTLGEKLEVVATADPGAGSATVRVWGKAGQLGDMLRIANAADDPLLTVDIDGNAFVGLDLDVAGDATAGGDLNAGVDVNAVADVNAGGDVTAGGNIDSSGAITGRTLTSTLGAITSATSVDAGTNISAPNGAITGRTLTSTVGAITSATSVDAATAVTGATVTATGTVSGATVASSGAVTAATNVAAPGVVQSPSITRYRVDGIVRSNVANLAAFTGVTGGTAVNGATFVQGARLLLQAQTTGAENGIYVVGAVAAGTAPLTRADDWATGQIKNRGMQVIVYANTGMASQNQNGGNNISTWTLTAGPVTVNTTAATFTCQDTLSGGGGGGSSQKVYTAQCVRTTNVADLTAFAVSTGTDGQTLVEFDMVLLVAQTTPAENGPYVVGTVTAGTAPLTRPPWFNTGRVLNPGFQINVALGTVFKGTTWRSFASGAYTVGTNDPVFYPERVCGRTQLGAGTFTISTVPILSTSTAVFLSRAVASNSSLTVGGYNPTTGGAEGITPGIIGTAAVIVEACVAAGTINNADDSTLHWAIHNQL